MNTPRMSIRDTLLAADDEGTLLESLAATKYGDMESVAMVVSELHNSSKIDIFSAYGSPQFDTEAQSFYVLRNLFCKFLPLLNCSTDAAISACENIFAKADTYGDSVYDSLTEWFRKNPAKIADGLSLIHRDLTTNKRLVKPVLYAWASHDPAKSTEEAIGLANQEQVHIRLDAIRTLGRIVPVDDDSLISRVVNQLECVIESPGSENDIAHAVETALIFLGRTGEKSLQAIEPLLVKACTNPNPATVHSLAFGFQCNRQHYSESMIDHTFSALQKTGKQDLSTIEVIDSVLYQWDIDGDRTRILQFLVGLLGDSDEAIELNSLSSFKHNLRSQPGAVLGWYVISLLLTGNHRLCSAAAELLPYKQAPHGLDIDLITCSLPPSSVLYLSRKILGYCISNRECASALLLSCLRAVPDSDRAELESLILEWFLMNYLTAIDWLEQVLAPNDPAASSVQRLSQEIDAYVKELEQAGICSAFRPTERERQLEGFRLADKFHGIQKKAEEQSILSQLVHKSNVLYGTSVISYEYISDQEEPQRKEISMGTFEHTVEIPRMEVFDPVGLHYVIFQFRKESPPK